MTAFEVVASGEKPVPDPVGRLAVRAGPEAVPPLVPVLQSAPLAAPPVLSLAALLDQARAAQAELAGQPLSITNHHRFIMNVFGG